MKKILSLGFALCLLLPSCAKREGGPTSSSAKPFDENLTAGDRYIHHYEEGERKLSLLWEGRSDYVLLIRGNNDAQALKAASIFHSFFLEATGVALPIVAEGAGEALDHYVSFGTTEVATREGASYRYVDRSESGYSILTRGENLYVLGGSDNGIVYGTYRLLKEALHLQYYGEKAYSIDQRVTEISLPSLSIVEVPDFEYRSDYVFGGMALSDDSRYPEALGINYRYSSYHVYKGLETDLHNSFAYLDPAIYDDEPHHPESYHPEWYSKEIDVNTPNVPAQLCYASVSESQEAYEITMACLASLVEKNPDISIFTFVHQDNTLWCGCEKCLEAKKKFGCDSYYYIRWINKLARGIIKLAPKSNPARKLSVCGMAYQANMDAPARYDKKAGKYVPADESVALEPNTYIYFAPHSPDYDTSLDDLDYNEREYIALRGWGDIVPERHLFAWIFNQDDFGDYFCFYDTFESMQRNYELFADCQSTLMVDLGQYNARNATAFNVLRAYLSSRLMWNVHEDYKELIDSFFRRYYGGAASSMREMFDIVRERYAMLHSQGVINRNYYHFASAEVYPTGFLKSLLALEEKAYSDIAPLEENDSSLYESIHGRIELDFLFLHYALIESHGLEVYTSAELKQAKLDFRAKCEAHHLTLAGEHAAISTLWNRWGI